MSVYHNITESSSMSQICVHNDSPIRSVKQPLSTPSSAPHLQYQSSRTFPYLTAQSTSLPISLLNSPTNPSNPSILPVATPPSPAPLSDLPLELIYSIFSFLPPRNIVRLAQVCSHFKAIVRHLAWSLPITLALDQLPVLEKLLTHLNGSSSLQPVQLNLSQQWLVGRGTGKLSSLFKSCVITTLIVNGNGIKGAIKELALGLVQNTTLTYLDISHNYIMDEGAGHIAQALHFNSTLLHLDLSLNCIGSTGATHIAQLLLNNTSIKSLNLANNCFQGEGAIQIAVSLLHNTSLASLNISNNFFELQDVLYISQSLTSNKSLRKLDIHENLIGIEGIRQLLNCSPFLRHMSLGWYSFKDLEAKLVVESIKKGIPLQTLELHIGGYLTEKEGQEIFKPLLDSGNISEVSTVFFNSLTKSKRLTITLKLSGKCK